MKFDILNRFTGAVMLLAEIDCDESASRSVKLGLSVKWALKNGADLHGAYLRGADLRGADLSGADLYEANLHGANLHGADLYEADLYGAKDIPVLAAARTLIAHEGQIIGWKKCRGGVIVKMTVPAEARRSNATGRKCRAEFADVLEVIGADVGISSHDGKTEYRVGERVTCDTWCEDRWQECAGGIHFWLTREEAEDWQ